MTAAIKLVDLHKKFVIKHESSNGLFGIPHRRYESFFSLKGISFDMEKGDVLGVIGPNGSGKTTLLRILAGILKPSKGTVFVRGKVLPIMELGSEMNPELSGRENIFLSGTIMGFSRYYIGKRYPEIVSFSGLGKFIDVKTGNYSSGMRLRLAFSILLLADPDIILIDEVFGVGDFSFRQKCLSQMKEFSAKGKTIILVSQDFSLIRSFCSKALFLNNGVQSSFGGVEKVLTDFSRKCVDIDMLSISTFRPHKNFSEVKNHLDNFISLMKNKAVLQSITSFVFFVLTKDDPSFFAPLVKYFNEKNSCDQKMIILRALAGMTSSVFAYLEDIGRLDAVNRFFEEVQLQDVKFQRPSSVKITSVEILSGRVPKDSFGSKDDITIKISFDSLNDVKNPVFGVAVYSSKGQLISGPNTFFDSKKIASINGKGAVSYTVRKNNLLPGKYYVSAAIHTEESFEPLDISEKEHFFFVKSQDKTFGLVRFDSVWKIDK